ncbi:MAG: hypothetical protein MJZ60_08870 [Bacteroidaceae bacterium]|nr:hypothetical protein [Bacteroidaceae bacterium]
MKRIICFYIFAITFVCCKRTYHSDIRCNVCDSTISMVKHGNYNYLETSDSSNIVYYRNNIEYIIDPGDVYVFNKQTHKTDSFQIWLCGYSLGIYPSKNDSIVYMTARVGTDDIFAVVRANYLTHEYKELNYTTYGYNKLDTLPDKYVVLCVTNPCHSADHTSLVWRDTLDKEFNFIASSDTLTI